MDPSGTFIQYDAKAIGSGSEGAQQSLQEVYHKVRGVRSLKCDAQYLWLYLTIYQHVYLALLSVVELLKQFHVMFHYFVYVSRTHRQTKNRSTTNNRFLYYSLMSFFILYFFIVYYVRGFAFKLSSSSLSWPVHSVCMCFHDLRLTYLFSVYLCVHHLVTLYCVYPWHVCSLFLSVCLSPVYSFYLPMYPIHSAPVRSVNDEGWK